ncbi:MAG: type IV pilin-like G/H family protein [Cyanobacteria bacterium P01_A01_bin.123]
MTNINLVRSMQLTAIALLAGTTLAACGARDAVEEIPEIVDSSVDEALQSEGKTFMGTIVRGQQAYFLGEGQFAGTLEDLALGLAPETDQYTYAVVEADDTKAIATATAKQEGFKSYSAAVYAVDESTVRLVCEADEAGSTPPGAPQLSGTEATCPAGSSAVE